MHLSKIIKAGLIVGTLDICAASTQYFIRTGKGPDGILKFVASGVFGKAAATGGVMMSIAGLLFHYIIAFSFTLFFFWLYPKIYKLLHNRIVIGILYGAFIWTVMNLVVVPLSNTQKSPMVLTRAITAMAILIVCIGIPLSFLAGRRSAENKIA